MTTHPIIKSGIVALALVVGASVLRPSSLEATGHLMSSGRDGTVTCVPGGPSDCTPVEMSSDGL